MINSIVLKSLRNAEYLGFQSDVIDIVNGNDNVKQKVIGKLTPVVEKNSLLQSLFKTDQASPLTEKIEQLDFERDQAIIGLGLTIEGFTHHYKPDVKNAAVLLYKNIGLYGGSIAQQNYQAETTILKNIVTDWEEKAELKQAVNTLNLADWKEYMKYINLQLNQKYAERNQETSQETTDTIKAVREEANQDYYKLRDVIVSYANILDNDPDFEKVIKEINVLIDKYNLLLTKRAPSEEDNKDNKDA